MSDIGWMTKEQLIRLMSTCLLAVLTYFSKGIFEDVRDMRIAQAQFHTLFSEELKDIHHRIEDHEGRLRGMEKRS